VTIARPPSNPELKVPKRDPLYATIQAVKDDPFKERMSIQAKPPRMFSYFFN